MSGVLRGFLRRLVFVLPILVASHAFADPAPPTAEAPYVAVRSLQSLQDQVAHGDASAQSAQPKLIAHIADVFLAVDPAVWKEPRNTRAAVLFLLSGGKPSVVRTVLSRSETAPDLDRLLKGALAYGEGQDEAARTLLDPVDPRTLPSGLGGQVALIQAALQADRNPAKASRSLDLARLLMPGTLVEEAALRRQIFLMSGPEATDKFSLLSRQYIRRFKTSVYAANFKQRFATTVVRLAENGRHGPPRQARHGDHRTSGEGSAPPLPGHGQGGPDERKDGCGPFRRGPGSGSGRRSI